MIDVPWSEFTLDSPPTGACAAILAMDKIAQMQRTGHSLACCAIALPFKDLISTSIFEKILNRREISWVLLVESVVVLPVEQHAAYH